MSPGLTKAVENDRFHEQTTRVASTKNYWVFAKAPITLAEIQNPKGEYGGTMLFC
jgi:hypothetical protein